VRVAHIFRLIIYTIDISAALILGSSYGKVSRGLGLSSLSSQIWSLMFISVLKMIRDSLSVLMPVWQWDLATDFSLNIRQVSKLSHFIPIRGVTQKPQFINACCYLALIFSHLGYMHSAGIFHLIIYTTDSSAALILGSSFGNVNRCLDLIVCFFPYLVTNVYIRSKHVS